MQDGLKPQLWQRDAKELADAAEVYKNLVLYVDDGNLLKTQEKVDDVVLEGSSMPEVLTPIVPLKVRKQRKRVTEEAADAGQHSGSDTDLFDSDYDFEDEFSSDDDDFVKVVDDDVEDVLIKKQAEEEVWADAPEEDDELQLPEREDE